MSNEPLMEGCPCSACAPGWTRGYWHYLLRNRELTGQRLLTLHNLAFVQRVVARLRDAILDGSLAGAATAIRAGDAP